MTDAKALYLRHGEKIDYLGTAVACLSVILGTAVFLSIFFAWTSFLGEPNDVLAAAAIILPGIGTIAAGFHLADRIVATYHKGRRQILQQILQEAVAARHVAYDGCDWKVSGQEPDALKLTLSRAGAPSLTIHVSRIAEERGLLR